MNPQPVETRTEHAVDAAGNGLIGLAILFFFLIPFYFLFTWIYRKAASRWGEGTAAVIVAVLVVGSWCVLSVWSQTQDDKLFTQINVEAAPADKAQAACVALEQAYGQTVDPDEEQAAWAAWSACLQGSPTK